MTHNIELVPIKGERGGRAIIVNSKPWGMVRMEGAGRNGSRYFFEQIGRAGYLCLPGDECYRGGRGVPFSVPGERIAFRMGPFGSGVPEPLYVRLIAGARRLIDVGRLRDPDVVTAELQAEAERIRQRNEAAETARRKEMEARARMALAPVDLQCSRRLTAKMRAILEAEIIAAMTWAVTRDQWCSNDR